MFEVTIILPLKSNELQDLTAKKATIERAILTVAGGYTADSVRGSWLSDSGVRFDDVSDRITTVVDSQSKVSSLRSIAENACILLRQEAIFFQVRGVEVEFITEKAQAA